ncbi:MAG TPA: DUF4136 domain-containing protein [Bacteroidia bacterium]|nr:DUF4136 domain-containing protein [Bacteroidia bacterium]
MKKNLKSILAMLFLTLTIAGCYPGGPDYADEYDIVYTNYDKDFNFGGKKFYAMPDSIVKITGDVVQGEPLQFIKQVYANTILNRIKSNMASRGYTLVTDTSLADLFLVPSALEVTTTTYYYGYYWEYYPYAVSTSYTTGSVIMNLVEKSNSNPSNKNRVVWVGIINGLLEGSSTSYDARINKGVDQAFTQSQYIHP